MNFQQIRDFVNPAVGQATGIEPVENLAMPVPTAHMMQSGGGGSITVDSELSETSTNPVENRVITAALNNLYANKFFPIHARITETGIDVSKTFVEISAAYNSGKIPVLYLERNSEGRTSLLQFNFAAVRYQGSSADPYVFSFSTPIEYDTDARTISGTNIKYTLDGLQPPVLFTVQVTN